MKKILPYYLLCTIAMAFAANIVVAQISQARAPRSFDVIDKSLLHEVPFEKMRFVDVEKLKTQDIINDQQKDIPWRFGDNIDVDYDIYKKGVWDKLPDGSRICRLGIKSPGALSINLLFNQYMLPKGAELYIYSPDYKQQLGAFTDFNNQADGLFATTLILTDNIIIEYYEPSTVDFPGKLVLSRVTHGYRGVGDFTKAFGNSGLCNVNVACPQSARREEQIRSVAMLVTGGNGFCTGALINNTRHDGTPYFLSANHCFSNPGSIVFWFNWQSATCANPSSSPAYNSLSGAVTCARYAASDMWLLQLNNTVPVSFNPFFAGWNRTLNNNIAGTVYGVHHPSADIKKLSWSILGVSTTTYLQNSVPGNGTHWRVTSWSDGTTTEPGSSGSPLFDPDGRIIGQLHGGYASCTSITSDWYGKFGVSWTGGGTSATRLSNWLDPINAGATTLNGYDPIFVSGPTIACTCNTTFTINNMPEGTTVSWSHDPNLLTYVSGQGTLTYTVKAINSLTNGSGWVRATLNGPFGEIVLPDYIFWVGKPNFNIISDEELEVRMPGIAFIDNQSHDPYSVQRVNRIDWSYTGPLTNFIGGLRKATFRAGNTSGQGFIYANAFNSCGATENRFYFQVVESFKLNLSPNPALEQIEVSVTDNDAVENNILDLKYFVSIVDSYGIVEYSNNHRGKAFTINISRIPKGLHTISVERAGRICSANFIKGGN